MPLIVEDGTAMANADSYCTELFAETYFEERGKQASWTAIADPEAALRLATEYMEANFGTRWKGKRVNSTQALSWPRVEVNANGFDVASNVVPTAVKKACAELALKTASGDLMTDTQKGLVVSESFEGMSRTYAGGTTQKRFAFVESMLTEYLASSGAAIKLVRA